MKTFLIFCVLLFTSLANAKSPVWKVTKGEHSLFIGGTIHVLRKSDYPLPESFNKAYLAADDVVLETDTLGMFAPDVAQKSLAVIGYQDHRTLSNVLSRDVLEPFSELLASKGIPLVAFDPLTPAGAVLTLISLELERLGASADMGVDLHFNKLANEDQKELHYLETIDEQLGFIGSLNDIDPAVLIRSGIRDVNDLESNWDALLSAWRAGDLAALEKLGITPLQQDFPNVYQTMLVKRNVAWLTDIETMIANPDVEFILVGAMHLAGDDGLIKQLTKQGYSLEQQD